ncbi:oxidoreductase [Arthrobacter sp. MN05-02]|nr:oxidoreductase [Arthrobacter sp. MN05-02]
MLVGFGHGGRVFHAPLIAHDPRFELSAVVARSTDRRRAARTAYPGAAVVDSLDEALEAVPDLDLAVISTPNATHAALAASALGRGLHVVVDKPFVVRADDGERLIETAHAAGRLLVPFSNRRWDGDYLTVRSTVESGVLGRVRTFESAMESWKPSITKAWKRAAGPGAGGGVLYDLGPHLIDQALVLFGPAVPAFADLRIDRAGGAADDTVFLVLQHLGGVTSSLHAGTLAPQVRSRFRVTGDDAGLTVLGTDPQEGLLAAGMSPGAVAAPGPADARGLLGRDGNLTPVPIAPGTYPSFYEGVAAAIEGGPVPVAAEDALAVVRIIEQVHAAFPARPR